MGIFNILAGKKTEATPETARAYLREIENANRQSPARAVKLLNKARPWYDYFQIGGELHPPFRQVVEAVWLREGHTEVPPPSDSVDIAHWQDWEYPTVGDVARRATEGPGGYLLLRSPRERSHRSPFAELEALRSIQPDTIALVFIDEDLLVKKSFLAQGREQLPMEDEEIMQALDDAAHKAGLKTGMVVV